MPEHSQIFIKLNFVLTYFQIERSGQDSQRERAAIVRVRRAFEGTAHEGTYSHDHVSLQFRSVKN